MTRTNLLVRPERKNKMKKILSLLLVLCLIFSLASCGSTSDMEGSAGNEQQTESNSSETTPPDDKSVQSDEKLGTFNKNASLAETVMVDEGGVRTCRSLVVQWDIVAIP